MKPGWQFDHTTDTWLWGTERNGAGVFQEGDTVSCNVVNHGDIVFLEGFQSIPEAMESGEREFERRKLE